MRLLNNQSVPHKSKNNNSIRLKEWRRALDQFAKTKKSSSGRRVATNDACCRVQRLLEKDNKKDTRLKDLPSTEKLVRTKSVAVADF